MEGDMRKFILITAMVLVSAAAHASDPRSLTMGDAPVKSTEVKATDAKTVDAAAPEAPVYVERPSAVDTNATQPATQPAAQCQPAPTTAEAPKTETSKIETPKSTKDFATFDRPKPRRQSTQSRIISELHRHGIYW
jgi:hypothetical protein